jgi:hypothetical protein
MQDRGVEVVDVGVALASHSQRPQQTAGAPIRPRDRRDFWR